MNVRFQKTICKTIIEDKIRALGYTTEEAEGISCFYSEGLITVISDIHAKARYVQEVTESKMNRHIENVYKLVQFGAVILDIESKAENIGTIVSGRQCFCGSGRFGARQLRYHKVAVDGHGRVLDNHGPGASPGIEGPFTCERCKYVFRSLGQLQNGPLERKSICLNGELCVGDLVLSTSEAPYAYLIGTVREIQHLGTPEHETENDEDDIYVDFSERDYSDRRIAEIEAMFSYIYQEKTAFEECNLDGIIMAPSSLIRITGISGSQWDAILDSEAEAAEYSMQALGDDSIKKDVVMVLFITEKALDGNQYARALQMLPSDKTFVPIEYHNDNLSAYGFIVDAYYKRHDYDAEHFNSLVMPILEDYPAREMGYLLTPDNQRIYIREAPKHM